MEKISSFQITGLELSGFKCFKDPVRFDFGGITNILGSIHVGKSSIADAIAFAITGTTFWGGKRGSKSCTTSSAPALRSKWSLSTRMASATPWRAAGKTTR
ncbi:AAA family ATPase [Anaerotruncus colihominis]|uniref:AAA family ATPase n=1 Tax=Anaerotruncus colihominis TaxID=169435 RepID=UPI003C6C3A93